MADKYFYDIFFHNFTAPLEDRATSQEEVDAPFELSRILLAVGEDK